MAYPFSRYTHLPASIAGSADHEPPACLQHPAELVNHRRVLRYVFNDLGGQDTGPRVARERQLEAMSLGVPVVTTTAGSIPEVVGDAASDVPPGDVDALAGALEAVLDDHTLAAGLRDAGQERARLFTWERCGDQMADLYAAAAHAT